MHYGNPGNADTVCTWVSAMTDVMPVVKAKPAMPNKNVATITITEDYINGSNGQSTCMSQGFGNDSGTIGRRMGEWLCMLGESLGGPGGGGE